MFKAQDTEAITAAAKSMGISPASMIALGLKESSGRVFWTVEGQQLPAIRPETHHFYKQLSGVERDQAVAMGLAHPRRNAIKLPQSYAGIYQFYYRMCAINLEAAAASTSHGWGQVMGFNANSLGYSSARELADRAHQGLQGQTELVGRFLQANGLIPYMNSLPSMKAAEAIARKYNGPKWRENNYANDLVSNFHKVLSAESDLSTAGQSIRDLQVALTYLGYKPGAVDGYNGNATKAAVREFQRDNGLLPDGDAGPLTWSALDEQSATKRRGAKEEATNIGAAAATGIGATAIGVEVLGYVRDLQTSLGSILANFGIAGPLASAAMAGGVGYFVYSRFLRKG